MDGPVAERLFAAFRIWSYEPDGNCLFCRGIYVAGASKSAARNIADWYGGRYSADDAAKIFRNTYRYYAHNLYTGMEKGLGQPAGNATDVKSFNFIRRCGLRPGPGGRFD